MRRSPHPMWTASGDGRGGIRRAVDAVRRLIGVESSCTVALLTAETVIVRLVATLA